MQILIKTDKSNGCHLFLSGRKNWLRKIYSALVEADWNMITEICKQRMNLHALLWLFLEAGSAIHGLREQSCHPWGRTAIPAPSLLPKLHLLTAAMVLSAGRWALARCDLCRLQMWVWSHQPCLSKSAVEFAGDELLGLSLAVCVVQEGGTHKAEWWKQPRSAAVWQGDRAGAAHRELAVVTDDRSVGALFV